MTSPSSSDRRHPRGVAPASRAERDASAQDEPPRAPAQDTDDELAAQVERAQAGDAGALAAVLAAVTDGIYRLALRMVSVPVDAEDATQEILVRVMTRLSTFRWDAAFTTWVYRIAVNHLIDRARSPVERMEFTFDSYAKDLLDGLGDSPTTHPEAEVLAEEVRLACTQGMLTCLDRAHRLAYVLGEVFEVPSEQAAAICDVPAATYRKRLSRARARIRAFVGANCGLVNTERPCRCTKRVDVALAKGRIDPDRLRFTDHPVSAARSEMQELFDVAALFRSHPQYAAPDGLTERIRSVVHSGRYQILR